MYHHHRTKKKLFKNKFARIPFEIDTGNLARDQLKSIFDKTQAVSTSTLS